MVSTLSIIFMGISAGVCILLPIGLTIYFYRKERISIKAVLVGALVFFLFQIATRIPLLNYLSTTDWYTEVTANQWLLALFLAFTAGLFEEVGRFLGFRYPLKDRLEWKNGIAFGIGHGGIESILLAGLPVVNYVVYAVLINSGQFDIFITPNLPQGAGETIRNILVNTPSWQFLIAGLERIFAITIQIGLSLIVLYSVKSKKYIYMLYSILLHLLLDAPAVLVKNITAVELFVFICAIASLIFIIKSRKLFDTGESIDTK